MFRVLACIATQHDTGLVPAAALVCVLSAAVSFALLARAPNAPEPGRLAPRRIATAAAALGGGAWATHFVAMLAYDPGLPTAFDPVSTSGSAAMAFIAAFAAVAVWGRMPHAAGRALSGAILGLGIGAMHYVGMAAVRIPGAAQSCDEVQGYLIGKPLPLDAFLRFVEQPGDVSALS